MVKNFNLDGTNITGDILHRPFLRSNNVQCVTKTIHTHPYFGKKVATMGVLQVLFQARLRTRKVT